MKINLYGYELPLKKAIKLLLRRLYCSHKSAKFNAATVISCTDKIHGIVGVVMFCGECRRSWTGDIKAAIWNTYKPKREKNESM